MGKGTVFLSAYRNGAAAVALDVKHLKVVQRPQTGGMVLAIPDNSKTSFFMTTFQN